MIDETVTNVFIMLAHDGIKNKYVWEEYLKDNSIGLLVYVYINSIDIEIDLFTQKYKASRKTCSIISVWGHSSLVEIEIELMKEALIKFPNAISFHTISGRDIPVVSSIQLCSRNNQTCLESGEQSGFYIKEKGNNY